MVNRNEIEILKKAKLKDYIPVIIMIGTWVAISVIWGNQGFVCNKIQNSCYSSVFGFKAGEEIKITDIYEATVITGTHRSGGKVGIYKTTYMPTLITKNGAIDFYKRFETDLNKSNTDIAVFKAFLASPDMKTLALSNKCFLNILFFN